MFFSHMIFYVKNVKDTVKFYEQAFGLEVRFIHESGQYAEMETGQTALSFASLEAADMNLPGGYQQHSPEQSPFANEITFTSKDVNGAYAKAVAAGATALTEPLEKPWGQLVGYVRDPDGILIEIGSEMGK